MGIKMWIRTQNNEKLMNCNSFRIGSILKKNKILGEIEAKTYVLGGYSTKEKALKVLDKIQVKIECPYPIKVMPAFGTNCYHLSEKGQFYQMPQDDEV